MRPSYANPFLEPGDVKPGEATDARPFVASEPARPPLAAPTSAETARVAAAVRALEDGRAFAVIVEADQPASARAVAGLARELTEPGVPVTVVGNETPWPLTLDKLIAQVGGEPGSDPEQLLREAMAGPFHDRRRAVLAIDRADTLDDRAMSFLADLSKALRAGGSEFQLVFAGPDPLLGKLSAHGFAPPRAVASRLGASRRPGVPRAALAAGVAVLLLAVVGLSLAGRDTGAVRQPQAALPAAAPSQTAAPPQIASPPLTNAPDQAAAPQPSESVGAMTQAPAAAPPAPEAVAAPAPVQPMVAAAPPEPAQPEPLAPTVKAREAALREEFGAFLDRSGVQTAKLTPEQRDQLFKDYLVWRLRPGNPDAATP